MSKNMIFLVVAALAVGVVSNVIRGVNVLSAAGIGVVVGNALGTVAIAVIIALIPVGIYWLFKRKPMPGLNIVIWSLWALISILALIGSFM